jgi:uncharacterized surface protein with fasciclin (FAS1) repeats
MTIQIVAHGCQEQGSSRPRRGLLIGVACALMMATFPASAGNIIQELKREGRFTTLLAGLDAAGLTATVARCNSCTLFAPNNNAFARLPAPTVAALLKPGNRKKLGAILTYHVVGARIPAGAVPPSPTLVQTLNASEAKVLALRRSGNVSINGVRVLEANIHANGSIVHEVRDVLWPGELR